MGGDDLIGLWELGAGRSPIERSLTLLGVACPELTAAQRAAMSLGRRNAHLFALRERFFGSALPLLSHCPACEATMEYDASTQQFHIEMPAQPESSSLSVGDLVLRYRLLCSEDLLAIATLAAPDAALRRLLCRCVLSATRDGVAVNPALLPAEAIHCLAQAMAEQDPQAEIDLTLICPRCAQAFQTTFDIGEYFFRELSVEVQRLTEEVHKLASAYGWREEDVLKMSAQRRYLYLKLVGA